MFTVDGDEVLLRPLPPRKDMGGVFRGSDLMADLREERRLEAARKAKQVAR